MIADASLHICMGIYIPPRSRLHKEDASDCTFALVRTVLCTCSRARHVRMRRREERRGTDLLEQRLRKYRLEDTVTEDGGFAVPSWDRSRSLLSISRGIHSKRAVFLVWARFRFGIDSPRITDRETKTWDVLWVAGLSLIKSVSRLWTRARRKVEISNSSNYTQFMIVQDGKSTVRICLIVPSNNAVFNLI